LLIVTGWLAYLDITQFSFYLQREKAVPPFSEQSQYALCLGLLSTAYAFVAKRKEYVVISMNVLLQALLMHSLTLFVFFIISFFPPLIKMKKKQMLFAVAVAGSAMVAFLIVVIRSDEYFYSRLSFVDASNLTSLVWLQGWESVFQGLVSTSGLGVGFQMMGLDQSFTTSLAQKIISIAGIQLNIHDGGFLFSKLVTEFGLVGLVVCFIYVRMLLRSIIFAVKNNRSKLASEALSGQAKKEMLLQAFIVGFFVEMFFRGTGYFSIGVYLVMSFYMASLYKPAFQSKKAI